MKRALMLACLLALCHPTLFAQTKTDPRTVHTTEKSAIHVPPRETPASLKIIYSNLGSSKTDLYDDADGWALSGPTGGYTTFIAIPFTPKSNSHVSQVRAAVNYSAGANQVNLSLFGDSGGTPGTLLAGPVTVTNLPDEGTCCTLAVADFTPVAVTGGTRYWLVADTPLSGTGSDFSGGWAMVAKIVPIAFSGGDDWFTSTANDLPAGQVLGTIP